MAKQVNNKDADNRMNMILSDLLTKLYEIEATIAEYSEPRCRQLLQPRLEEFMRGLQQYKECAEAYNNVPVPTALLSFIDASGHPDEYIKSIFQQAVIDSQLAAGKVAAVDAMRQSLAAAAAETYPDAATAYRTAVESKQQQPGEQQQQDEQQQQQQGQQQ